jgi:uncharacterized protein
MQHIPSFNGFGLGMRSQHYSAFIAGDVPVDFVEVISENFMVAGGRPLHTLAAVRAHYPVALHGVSMSLGSANGLRADYLLRLKALANTIEPLWVSDHLSWSSNAHFNAHDLLPLPYTQEALDVVCANIHHAQEILGRALLIENPSSYLTFTDSDMGEAAFIAAMMKRTGCYLLLDVNNIYVSSQNHGFSAQDYLAEIPQERVRQIHLAGHTQGEHLLIDTHDQPVPDPVWALYAQACVRFGSVATMIERDDNIPELPELLYELEVARQYAQAELVAA